MSDYQRFVTYINLYEKDEKRKNVGFAKIEKRKEQCRFEIHMKNIGYTGQNSQIYFYVRQEQRLACIAIGNVQIINGTADRRILLNGDNIAGSGLSLEKISGFVIFINEEIMLASQWHEGEMSRRLFLLPGQESTAASSNEAAAGGKSTPPGGVQGKAPEPAVQTKSMPPGAVQGKAPEPVVQARSMPPGTVQGKTPEPAVQEMSSEVMQGKAPVAAEIQKNNPDPANVSIVKEEHTSNESEQPDSLHVAEAAVQAPEAQSWNNTWQMMLETYPVLTPFEGENNVLCIRMELKDLRMLPRRYWYLGNNSFLLHGFFNYRYIVLGQMEEKGIKRWFLGVPGVFQNQEKVMAAIFGFPEFRAEKITKQKTNQFGYWYRFMDERG